MSEERNEKVISPQLPAISESLMTDDSGLFYPVRKVPGCIQEMRTYTENTA
ncbi:hypothetical protein [Microcoleus vaginatus]|uniref:hypothetical protein n=1 Tax=Microcoleus vaginatus TaxID=119532 RepID=UPI0032AC68CA